MRKLKKEKIKSSPPPRADRYGFGKLYAQNAERVVDDTFDLQANFPKLVPKEDFYTNKGIQEILICLVGTITVTYSDTKYDVPIKLWVPKQYPMCPPICYVTPSNALNPASKIVDLDGRCNIPSQNWTSKSNLLDFMVLVRTQFSEQLPIVEGACNTPNQSSNPLLTPLTAASSPTQAFSQPPKAASSVPPESPSSAPIPIPTLVPHLSLSTSSLPPHSTSPSSSPSSPPSPPSFPPRRTASEKVALHVTNLQKENIGMTKSNSLKQVVRNRSKSSQDDKTIKILQKGADQGNPKDQYKLGCMCETGRECDLDYNKAFQLYQNAANQSYPPAQYRLGLCYKNGKGCAIDYGKAMEWLEKAVDNREIGAQRVLGKMFLGGEGCSIDKNKAKDLLNKASKHGDVKATSILVEIEKKEKEEYSQQKLVEKIKKETESKEPAKQKQVENTSNENTHATQFEGEWKIRIPSHWFTDQISSSCFGCIINNVDHPKEYSTIKDYLNCLGQREIDTIQLIQSGNLQRIFHGAMENCEIRMKTPAFQSDVGLLSAERQQVLAALNSLACTVKHNRGVKVIRAWHGTSVGVARSIVANGFASLATLDEGWFGKGIYFTTNPEYALRYCTDKPDACLMLCYLIIFNPYPVIWEDAKSSTNLYFEGKANYKNFGCHYVPVYQYSKMDFRPPQSGTKAQYDEIVIFQENHILPHAIIRLKSTVPQSPKLTNVKNWKVNDVANWMLSLALSKDYTDVVMKEHITGEVLLLLTSKDDLKELGVTAFGDQRLLMTKLIALVQQQ